MTVIDDFDGGDTLVPVSSDEEDNAFHGDDGAAYGLPQRGFQYHGTYVAASSANNDDGGDDSNGTPDIHDDDGGNDSNGV